MKNLPRTAFTHLSPWNAVSRLSPWSHIMAIGSMAFLLSACGDDITEQINANVGAVETSKDLPECTKDIAGQTAFVAETHEFLGCDGKEWQTLSANTVSVGDNVCTSTSLSDGTGFEIFCNGQSIGMVRNGKDGTDGKDGAPGEKGDTGEKGDKGDTGADGTPGTNGTNGTNGKDGTPGTNGKDGAGCKIQNSTELTATIACGSETFTMDLTGYVELPAECDATQYEDCTGPMDNVDLSGVSQKGPFVIGTDITAYELENGRSLKQTGKTFGGKIEKADGTFDIRTVKLKSTFAYIVADGFYRNEVTGENSASAIKLRAFTNLQGRSSANINLVTHLEYDRILNLVTRKDYSVANAKIAAEKEIFNAFYINNSGFGGFAEDYNVLEPGDGNAALLAISALLQGDRTEAQLTALLASLSVDLGDNGEWDNKRERAQVADWAMKADIDGRLASIRANVEGWKLSDSKAPAFEAPFRNFWMTELGVDECGSGNDGALFAVKNKNSAYYAKNDSAYSEGDSSLVRLICDASGDNPTWRFATDIEKDTAALSADAGEGSATTGSINTGRVYVKENGTWRRGTQLDIELDASCVADIKKHTTFSTVSTDTTWYICVDDGSKLDGYTVPTSWRKATETEADTAQFGIPESAADSIKQGHINKGRYFVYDNDGWRRGTENDRLLEKACLAKMVGNVYRIKNQFYTCTDEKKIQPDGFEVVTTWRVSTADEADNYFTENPEQDGAVKQGDMDKARIYVFENGEWRRGTALDLTLGVGCLAANEGTVFKTASNKYYTCTAERQTVDGVLVNNTWRESTPDEADNYFTATPNQDGVVKRGDMDSTRIYVYEGEWRRGTNLDLMLEDGCIANKEGSIKKLGNNYYTCTTESALENGATVANTWRASTPEEADTVGWPVPTKSADSVKTGNIDDSRVYVYEMAKWRRGTNLDLTLKEGCLANKEGNIKNQGNKYYTCTKESVLENGATVDNTWRASTPEEADTVGWPVPTKLADSVKTGNVDNTRYYVYESSKWRLGTYLDKDNTLGPCTSKKINVVKSSGGVYYKCVNSGGTLVGGEPVAREWRKATNYEMDTYSLSSTANVGTYSAGSVNKTIYYVKDSTGWRPATDLENAGLKACTYVQKDSVKVSSAGTKDSWYKCTNEVATSIDGFVAKYTWRKATDIEKDTVGWGKSSYSTGDVKYGKINTNLVYVRQNLTWRHGTSLDMLLKNAGGKACITDNDTSTVKYDNVYYVCKPQSTPDTVRKWVVAPAIYNDTKEARSECKENGLYGDGTILVGRVNTERMYVCDNGKFRPALSDEISYNRACVSYIKNLYIYRVNGVFRKCTNSGWVRAEDRTFAYVKDAAGTMYRTEIIGTQQWMIKNLNYATDSSYCYNANADTCAKYGRLYTFSAAKMACPKGWHLPTRSEYYIMIEEAEGGTFDGGTALKHSELWDGKDVVGFGALPGGYYNVSTGVYGGLGSEARFWTSTANAALTQASHMRLRTNYVDETFSSILLNNGRTALSVRCIQD